MNSPSIQPEQIHYQRTWRTLQFFNVFRIFLALGFLSISFISAENQPFSAFKPELFTSTSLFFLISGILGAFAIQHRRPNFNLQVYLYALIDIAVITTLAYATNSVDSGLATLLVITIAGTALLIPERGSSLIAAIATITVLGEHSYSYLYNDINVNYTQAGLLGATFFATAFLTTTLTKRLRESEELAEQRGIDLANMAQLNEHVIQLLQSGVLVIDENNRIRLINQSAWQLFGMPVINNESRLGELSEQLNSELMLWRQDNAHPLNNLHINQSNTDIIPHFSYLGGSTSSGVLISLENASELAQQAQQLKLASLGQLTASIAHEIRNPLGAISHAAQLLEESPALDKGDTRLLEIINQHSSRVNNIIENILQLSRKERFRPISLDLKPWLEDFAYEFMISQHVEPETIHLEMEGGPISIVMDASQLHQVLWNLCQNGLRHSKEYPDNPKLEIKAGIISENQCPYVEVIDHGSGIPPEKASNIFEPFFTTESSGTGLGLYIARELCECNRARLEYFPVPRGGSRFRITFSTPESHK